MTTLNVNTIKPAGATLTLGESGDSVVFTDDVKVNLVKGGADATYAAFTSTGASTWTCPAGITSIEVLTVAGGGGGAGYYYGGAGGAGGVVHATDYAVTAGVVYDITVGAGGAGGGATTSGTTGSDSVWNVNAEGSGLAFTAKGGGGGGSYGSGDEDGKDGGSGGGAGPRDGDDDGGATIQASFSGATSYGNAGGSAGGISAAGSGGGGAGEAGNVDGAPTSGGAGGYGGDGVLFSNFTAYGVAGYFAGGGGGGGGAGPSIGGPGGTGGGGTGASYNSASAVVGTVNTGGGGGAGASHIGSPSTSSGAAGGSGVVLLKYSSGPNTLWSSNGSGVLSSVAAGIGGADKLLATTTISSAVANISFTSGIDSSYREYVFRFISLKPSNDNVTLQFNCSTDGGSNYNANKTSTYVDTNHSQGNAGGSFSYGSGRDLANSTAFQQISPNIGNVKESAVGELHLFNPSSTTYVKNWFAVFQNQSADADPYSQEGFPAGFFDTTSAINAIQFKFASGNMAQGIIKMYGIAS